MVSHKSLPIPTVPSAIWAKATTNDYFHFIMKKSSKSLHRRGWKEQMFGIFTWKTIKTVNLLSKYLQPLEMIHCKYVNKYNMCQLSLWFLTTSKTVMACLEYHGRFICIPDQLSGNLKHSQRSSHSLALRQHQRLLAHYHNIQLCSK